MSAPRECDAVATAECKLEALKACVAGLEAKEARMSATLRRLQTRLEGLQRERDTVRQHTRDVNADTAAILNELRNAEELETLNSMLVEKNLQIVLQQLRHDALLEQLARMEAMCDKTCLTQRPQRDVANKDNALFASRWVFFCERLRRHVHGTHRYCTSHQHCVAGHPASPIHQSIRKMCRTAREREEELVIQHEYVDAMLQQTSLANNTAQGAEAEHTRRTGELGYCSDDVAKVEELAGLRVILQQTKDLHNHLLLCLKKKNLLLKDSKLTPPFSSVDISPHVATPLCEWREPSQSSASGADRYRTDLLPLRSTTVLLCSRLNCENQTTNVDTANTVTAMTSGTEREDGNSNSNLFVVVATSDQGLMDAPLSHCGDVDSAPTVADLEVEDLQSEVAAAERDVHRLQQAYETLEEEAKRALAEYEENREDLEERLRKAQEVMEVLKREKTEWQALQEQMCLLST